MKKIILVITCLLIIVGCSLTNNTPTKQVKEYLMKYKDLDEAVLADLELTSESEGLTKSQKDEYVKVVKRQYSNLKYDITEEKIDGEEATVTAKITVYDFYKTRKSANTYLENNRTEFIINDVYNNDKFVDYELKELLNENETVDYTLTFKVTKNDNGKWIVEDLDQISKQKLHGTYNYES